MCETLPSRPLRVLSVAHPAAAADGGRLRYRPLAGRPDLDVHLVVPERFRQFGRTVPGDPQVAGDVTTHVEPIRLAEAGPMSWYLHVYPGLRRLVRSIDPDVIHLWEEPWSAVALQACLLRGRAALVLEVDQNILKRLPPPFEAVRRIVLRRTAHVLARSPEAEAVVRARGYLGPTSAIGYGVDRDLFRPGEARGAADGLRLGYVGRIVPEKGLDDALDAMARCAADVKLAVMGEGPHEASLRRRAAALGLAERVTFQPWGRPAEVAAFLRSLDVCVLLTRTTASVREQFGRVVIEAQSCGVPVVGSDGGAIPSVVGAGGWIVPEGDPDALARLLERLAARPEEIAARGHDGRRNVDERFTYAAVARDLAAAWRESAAAG